MLKRSLTSCKVVERSTLSYKVSKRSVSSKVVEEVVVETSGHWIGSLVSSKRSRYGNQLLV